MINKLAKMVATFFYVGYLPAAPGTIASLLGLFLYIIIMGNTVVLLSTIIVVILLGFLLSGKAEKSFGMKDPGCIVIDEIAGILISLIFLPVQFNVLITAFFLFRAFDMFKIYPANKLESLGGSMGIMMDDIMAGIYTNIIMQVALKIVF